MRILVTGGPVHAYLDSVKIITNRFKGGLMVKLVEELAIRLNVRGEDNLVHYLTAKGMKIPEPGVYVPVHTHDGFDDYMKQVLELAPQMDAVVLGAAVANLIPAEQIKGKFPSHNYEPGDIIPINFKIAPRVIDMVKKVAPHVKLFGFKLLSNVSADTLVNAAYGILLESKATAVFANDTSDLQVKKIVTRERGVIESSVSDISRFIVQATADEYYATKVISKDDAVLMSGVTSEHLAMARKMFYDFADANRSKFQATPEGYVFGTIAIPDNAGGFITTGRGKNELEDLVHVCKVDHERRIVYAVGKKATLNAPLIDNVFKKTLGRHALIHYHMPIPEAVTVPYAPAGTVRDAERGIPGHSFNIEGHGGFFLYDLS